MHQYSSPEMNSLAQLRLLAGLATAHSKLSTLRIVHHGSTIQNCLLGFARPFNVFCDPKRLLSLLINRCVGEFNAASAHLEVIL